ncbi:hypothetical protein ALC60_04953 [Trachymyrmex zeteki]|uniref:DNA-directed DNA polymerase n=1 Tax=Mycetomoellerius zeteki TaxID=64791 RepID=A0A151X743_9HYME|nr:hypothetical protein ALC60_04953 [Trachymyrmex zeteki]
MENHERVEGELLEQCGQVANLAECLAWLQRCDECIERPEEFCCAKRPRLAVGHRQCLVRRFLEDASSVVLEQIRDAVERHGSVKVNTAFNGEFVANDKRANKSINTKNIEIYRYTDLREWFEWHVIEPTLSSLEEFQERDSGWAISRFPMTLKDIQKFERLNALPLRLTSDKKEKHVNVLYLQDPRNDSLGHFALITNLSRLVSSQISKKEHKKFFCDRCLHYFGSAEKLQLHTVDCQNINDCAIQLPSEDDKWLEFGNHCRKERVPFIVYADLECVLRKMEPPTGKMRRHIHINSTRYVRCSYDDALSSYRFRRDEDCIDCVEKLQDTRLPPRESFYNSLTGDTVSESDYAHAANVWQRFSIQTLGEYSDLYLKTDVLLRHGLRITKIHKVLQFAQSPWLRDYIELNTNFRTRAKNDFEKNLYKLMNNAVFGKTMENVRNHVDVKLLTKWDGRYGAEAMIAKPNFPSRSVFAENLIAVELRKLEMKFNKPIYVGMCILDISKVCLYEFHYEYMLPLFRDKCNIMYTDSDSLICIPRRVRGHLRNDETRYR